MSDWIDQLVEEGNLPGYVCPDDINGEPSTIVFIYTPDDDKLYTHTRKFESHAGLKSKHQELKNRYHGLEMPHDNEYGDIFGRIAYGSDVLAKLNDSKQLGLTEPPISADILSVWSSKIGFTYLDDCVHKLLSEKFINQNAYISIPDHPICRISEYEYGLAREVSPEAQDVVQRQMIDHNARGQEKQEQLKKAGVKPKPRPMQLGKEGRPEKEALNPGEKWWAMSSEDIIRSISDQIDIL